MNKQGYRTPDPEILMLSMLAVNGEMNQAELTAVAGYQESSLTQLMDAGLVGQWGGGRTFALTARGKAYVEMICRVPLPEKKEVWIDPRDGEQYGCASFFETPPGDDMAWVRPRIGGKPLRCCARPDQ